MQTVVKPGFDEYVTSRSGVLLRFAYLLCGDRHLAEDLVRCTPIAGAPPAVPRPDR